jgi:hypothetical protein
MGNELFKKVTEATGLPTELVSKELEGLLDAKGVDSADMTLEDLRKTLAEYVHEVILKAKDSFDQGITIEEEINPEDLGQE